MVVKLAGDSPTRVEENLHRAPSPSREPAVEERGGRWGIAAHAVWFAQKGQDFWLSHSDGDLLECLLAYFVGECTECNEAGERSDEEDADKQQ